MANRTSAAKVKYKPYPKYPFPRLRGLRSRLSPVRVFESTAWTRGGPWTSIIVVLFSARAVKRVVHRKPEALALDKLKPGQSILISTAPRRSGGKGR